MNDERINAALRDATDTQNVTIGKGVLASVDDVFGRSFGDAAAVVVADEKTFEVAGEEVQQHLEAAGRETVEPYVFLGGPTLAADYSEHREAHTALASKGANKQRPLRASTSTKNPDYPDTIYADNSIGPETVNTMPLSALEATMDHAEVRPTLGEGVEEAREPFEELREAGVDYDDVTRVLQTEAVEKFVDSYRELVEEIEKQGCALAR
jgi:alkanesulfonate monooxygenase SsuD/methylene tetrahydromethanopterin reductase-like flavin-dependent oxidoreductase (luciferase family)